MTDEAMMEWLNNALVPMFPDLSPSNPVVLICDGYGSHLHFKFLERCVQLGVRVILRPPHTSHVTQGEDVQQGHFHKFHLQERKAKAELKARLLVHPRRTQHNLRISQLQRSDIPKITKKAWEEAFSYDVCAHAWQAIGIWPIFNRRPYWNIRKQEEGRKEVIGDMNARDAMEIAAEEMQHEDIAAALLASESESESKEHMQVKRINLSTRWWGQGCVTYGEAWEKRKQAERERQEEDHRKEHAKKLRQELADSRRMEAAAAGADVHECLVQRRMDVFTLTKKQIQHLLAYFGQKSTNDNKTLT
jgi:hypothetical protein